MTAATTRRGWWAALAVTALVGGAAGAWATAGAGSPNASSFVPITPCRLLDTRPAPDNVGARVGALAANETFTTDVWGAHGNCTIPSGATGVTMNVTAINASAASFLTVFPAGGERPTAANLNWVKGQAPTPNAVTAALSADGKVSFYNLSGTVDLTADIVGYYLPPGAGPVGPAGAKGATGPAGATVPGASEQAATILTVAPAGAQFTSIAAAIASITDASAAKPYLVRVWPGSYTEPAPIVLKDHVEVEGAGPGSTVVVAQGNSAELGVMSATGVHTAVRRMTLHTSGSGTQRGLYVTGGADVHTADLVLEITTDSSQAANGYAFGAQVDGSTIVMDRTTMAVSAAGSATGIRFVNADATVHGLIATAGGTGSQSYGITQSGGTTSLHDVKASVVADGNNGDAEAVQVANGGTSTIDRLDATLNATSGAAGIGIMVTQASTATVERSTMTVTGAIAEGLLVDQGTLTMHDVDATVSGSGVTWGLHAEPSAAGRTVTVTGTEVTIRASGTLPEVIAVLADNGAHVTLASSILDGTGGYGVKVGIAGSGTILNVLNGSGHGDTSWYSAVSGFNCRSVVDIAGGGLLCA